MLTIALAGPFSFEEKPVKGDLALTILVDNSTSMELFDKGISSELFSSLENNIPVKIRTIASGEDSSIGTGILNNLEGEEHLLVITDGNSHGGKLLGDVMLFASQINATISTLDIAPLSNDAGVKIEGPAELIKDNEGNFVVSVNNIGADLSYQIRIKVDHETVIEETAKGSKVYALPTRFSEPGSHTMDAELIGIDDHFPQNNVFYKSIKVVPRPHVLFVADKPSLTDVMASIPSSLDSYMAVILDDLPASRILPSFDKLNSFVEDGNGLIVIGGPQSYESGGYKGTLLETLLPVKMGSGEEGNKSDVNIVVVIDISDSSETEVPYFKAFALSILDNLHETNNVGVVAFNSDAYEVAPILTLKSHEKDIREKIAKLNYDGQSYYSLGLQGAYDLLEDVGGSKNIIMITDGGTTNKYETAKTIDTARNLNARGVTVHTIGYGQRVDPLFLDHIARIGGGFFFKADETNKLKVLFGEPDPSEEPEYFNSLVALDTTHFITRGIDLRATIAGYNYVVPKPVSSLLVTTNKNIPILVVWRFGLGRVMTLATDDGSRWAGELLNQKNSLLLTKTVNWAIGDLSRKQAFDVTIRDTPIGQPTSVDVVASDMPKEGDLLFAKVDTNFYSADYTPGQPGFFTLLGTTAAANYPREYGGLGVNEEFQTLVEATGGQVFEPTNIEGIIEFVKAKSKRIKVGSIDLRWPFLIAALLIFLFDIAYRRIMENREEKR